MTTLAPAPKTFADAERVFAETMPNYTRREQQGILAQAVEAVIAHGGQLMGQAGCGVGKSYAYLTPAILSGKRVIVATSTKALQEQIANKDMPFLEQNLGKPFTWALLKGRTNYVCRQKLSEQSEFDLPALGDITKALQDDPEHSGDVEHFDIPEMNTKWNKLTMSSNECPGKSQCPFGDVCFAEKAKEKAADADVVITNTAMLLTDLRLRQLTDGSLRMLGDYELVILDEAHELPEITTNALSDDLRSSQIEKFAYDAMSWITGQQTAGLNGEEATDKSATMKVIDIIKLAIEDLWMKLEERRGHDDQGRPITDPVQLPHLWIVENTEVFAQILDGVRSLRNQIQDIRVTNGGTDASLQKQRLLRRCENMEGKLCRILISSETELVRWLETEKRFVRGGGTEEVLTLKASPIDVGPFLQETLWDITPTVMVSATLAVGRSFSYMVETLGLDGYNPLTVDVGTPFDYRQQARLFLPVSSAPVPKRGTGWEAYAQTTTLELIRAAGGGALVLFTSRKNMNDTYEALAPLLASRGIRCLKQGDAPNKALAQEFTQDTDSCLFALKSFFVGVDFQGRTCRLVIIDKMPFPVPTDILFKAQSNAVERKHGARSSFSKLSIPRMTLTLTQGFGRLIRHANDAGVVAILDSRLQASWGKSIVRNLPPAPVITELRDVQAFYSTVQAEDAAMTHAA